MSDPSGSALPGAVLFACGQNVIRSPMAAAITRSLFPKRVYCRSAGVRPGRNDPFMAQVMDEIGVDVSTHKPHTFEDLEDGYFDLIITLAPEAHHYALDFASSYAIDVEYWPTPDPSVVQGSRSQILDAYRGVRDALMTKIKQRFAWHPPAGS